MGNFWVIGNRSIITWNTKEQCQAHLEHGNINNITHIEISFEPKILELTNSYVNFSNGFFIYPSSVLDNIEVSFYGFADKSGFTPLTTRYDITTTVYVDDPSISFQPIFTKTIHPLYLLKTQSFVNYLINFVWLNSNQYALQVLITTHNIEISSDDVTYPDMLKLIKKKKTIPLIGATHYTYQIYYKEFSTNDVNSFQTSNTIKWYLDKYTTKSNSKVMTKAYNDQIVTDKLVQNAIIQASGSISFLEQVFRMGSKAFSAIHFYAIANIFDNLADYVPTVFKTVWSLLPYIFGLYGIFLIGLFFQSMAKADFSLIPNHFIRITNFVVGLIRMVINLFYTAITVLSNMPIAGWIAIVGVASVLIIFGISVST